MKNKELQQQYRNKMEFNKYNSTKKRLKIINFIDLTTEKTKKKYFVSKKDK